MSFSKQELARLKLELNERFWRLSIGEHNSKFHVSGRGHGLRVYQPGEPARNIHAGATAKQTDGTVLVRTRRGSTHINTMVWVGIAADSHFGGSDAELLKVEGIKLVAETAATVIHSQGDGVGLVTGGQGASYTPCRRGRTNYHSLLSALNQAQSGDGSLLRSLEHPSLVEGSVKVVVAVVDMDTLAMPEVQERLKKIAVRRELIIVVVSDLWDHELPNVGRIRANYRGRVVRINTSDPELRQEYEDDADDVKDKITMFVECVGARLYTLRTDLALHEQITSIFTPVQPLRRHTYRF